MKDDKKRGHKQAVMLLLIQLYLFALLGDLKKNLQAGKFLFSDLRLRRSAFFFILSEKEFLVSKRVFFSQHCKDKVNGFMQV